MKFFCGFLATCFIASANYVINEWLDAEFDKYHPSKKNRSVVTEDVKKEVVYSIWISMTVFGIGISLVVNIPFTVMCIWLWTMGIVYNVKPIRLKDIAFFDVLTESINNAIRFLMGWFIVAKAVLPPCSIIFGYWMAGAFLMAIKRYAEMRMIDDKTVAGNYRKSFKYYTENSLLISAFSMQCVQYFLSVFS